MLPSTQAHSHPFCDLAGALSQDPGQGTRTSRIRAGLLAMGLLAGLGGTDPASRGRGGGNSAAQGTLRPVCVACLALSLSFLVCSCCRGLRKMVSVASSARRQFPSRLWDPGLSKSCSWEDAVEATIPGLVPILTRGWVVSTRVMRTCRGALPPGLEKGLLREPSSLPWPWISVRLGSSGWS